MPATKRTLEEADAIMVDRPWWTAGADCEFERSDGWEIIATGPAGRFYACNISDPRRRRCLRSKHGRLLSYKYPERLAVLIDERHPLSTLDKIASCGESEEEGPATNE
jgi:hypothetical protein